MRDVGKVMLSGVNNKLILMKENKIMLIVGSGDNVHVEYTIPSNIKNLITDDFLNEFLYQLIRITGISPYDFVDDGIGYLPGTGGWYAAFGKACIDTNNKKLFDYKNSLEWYDSDIFDSEIIWTLIEKEFILGYKTDIIKRELDVEFEDVNVCDKCGSLMRKDVLIKNGEGYICPHCKDVDDGDKYKNGTYGYYRKICREVDEYKSEV